jgi:hypothetical protein
MGHNLFCYFLPYGTGVAAEDVGGGSAVDENVSQLGRIGKSEGRLSL